MSEGRLFIDSPDFRRAVLDRVKGMDPDLMEVWDAYEKDRRTQEIALMAVRNRLMPFATEEMRVVVGQESNTVDWAGILDKGKVVLVNLAPERVSPQSQQMLGVIILHQLVSAAKRRPEGKRRRFYAYCDEFQNYVTEEFGQGLVEMRKFEVSFVLAHQHLGQIERAGEWILQSVISAPQIRVVFHPGNRADAEVLARELFTGTSEVTGTRTKDELYRTFFEPQIVREGVESTTEGYTSGGSDSWDGEDFTTSSSDSHSESTTRSTIPVTHHKERQELASKTYRSLEDRVGAGDGLDYASAGPSCLVPYPGPAADADGYARGTGAQSHGEIPEPPDAKGPGASGRRRAEVEEEIQKRKARFKLAKPAIRKVAVRFPAHPHLEEQE